MHGYTKGYFTDETGRLFRDETGNLDYADPIPMEVELGRDNFGYRMKKNFNGVLIDAEQAAGAQVLASIDGGEFKLLGMLTQTVNEFSFPKDSQGYDVNYKFVHNEDSDPPIISRPATYWSPLESHATPG